jgi:integrase
MPTWTKVAIDAWATKAGVTDGHVFRPVNRGDRDVGDAISEKIIWQLLRPYASAAGVDGIAPHDMRRTCAKLCRAAGGELEQIQMLLGHSSVQTTERYLGTKQDLGHAPNDGDSWRAKILTLVGIGSPLVRWRGNDTTILHRQTATGGSSPAQRDA